MRTAITALLLLMTPAACATRPGTDDAPAAIAAADSLRGVIDIAGAEPGIVVMRASGAERSTVMTGLGRLLRQLAGIEVVAFGAHHADGTFHVADVAVRAANGIPAVDGTLEQQADEYVLVARDGRRHAIAHLPAALREHVGHRVWLAGPLDRAPQSFGIIR